MESSFFIKSLPFFDGLSERELKPFIHSANIRTYPRKKSLFIQGDKVTRFFVVINGWIKLYQTTMEGNEAVSALFTRGEIFGETMLIEGTTYQYSAEALQKSKLLEFPTSLLMGTAAHNPGFSLRLIQNMMRQIQRLQIENEHLAIMTAVERTACLIHQMYLTQTRNQTSVNTNTHIRFPYDKYLAAIRLGMKPETFSRALKELQDIGVKVIHDDISIANGSALEKMCCSNCSASPRNCPLAYNPQLLPKTKKISNKIKNTLSANDR